MRFASLGSGSKGNATLIASHDTLLMVDCGFSLRDTRRRLDRLGVQPEQLDAVLVTHEHSDHASGVAALSRAYDLPVYLTHGTLSSGRLTDCAQTVCFNAGDGFFVGDVQVQSIVVPHDAREPAQFHFSAHGCKIGVLTDLGSITPHVVESYRDCHALLLEFNHDAQMLAEGRYPEPLKRRVGGDWGHLNNRQACDLLANLDEEALRHLVIAHISEQNNHRSRVEQELAARAGSNRETVVWADQADGFAWIEVGEVKREPECSSARRA